MKRGGGDVSGDCISSPHNGSHTLSPVGKGKARLYQKVNLGRGRRPADLTGPYFLRYSLADGTRRWEHVGDDLDEAIAARERSLQEREVPMPDALATILKGWREKRTDKKCPLVFPNGGCNPDGHFLRSYKDMANVPDLTRRSSGFTSSEPHSRRGRCRQGLICLVQQWLGLRSG